MANSFLLEIITPEKRFFSGVVETVIVRTLSGEEGFLAGHIWACKLLDIGELWFREEGKKEYRLAAISGGFIDVREEIMIYTDSAEWPEDIDLERANEAHRRESEWLEQYGLSDEIKEEAEKHKQAVRRAANRKKVAAGGSRQRQ